jgi:CRP/FNR family transcriptional regulator
MDLQSYPFYENLTDTSLEFLQKNLKPIFISEGNLLFFQGEICKNILFLTKGSVRLYIQSEHAEEITLYELSAGEQCIVNTASTISQTEAIGSAVTLSDIEGYLLDVQSVKELTRQSDVYQNYLFSIYTLRMGHLTQLVSDIKFKNLDERVLEWLASHGNKIIYTTHEKIANSLGSQEAVISHILKELERDGKVLMTKSAIKLSMS